ncbi:hypothetical protein HP532_30305 [Pseudomonas sp. CrR25]|nr:hypothetical protein [Pseudomonas sp. CrR25]
MNTGLRLFLALLLILALPLNGMAGVDASATPCPMQAMGADLDTAPDCCADLNDAGQPCKSGQECKTASLLQVALLKAPVNSLSRLKPASHRPLLPSQTLTGVWRPPRA